MRNRLLPALTATFIAIYFIALTQDALRSYFTPDDCMTMYRSVMNPASALWRANLVFFENSVFVRPMACVWYRIIHDFVGFSPVPYHVANLGTLAANIWLTYCVARRLSESREAGALGALLIAYHGRFFSLYYNTSFVYDIICYFFYFSALLFYLRMRSNRGDREGPPHWWELGILGALYVCAMNAKELAVTFPGIVAMYELLYHREDFGRFSVRDLLRWAKTSGRGVVTTGVLTLMLVVGRASTAGLLKNPAFQPEFTWSHFMMTSRNFVSELFFQQGQLSSAAVLAIWAAMLAIAWWSKSRALSFAWLFVMLSVIPVAFIPPRSPGQYYIPFFGWVLFFAVAVTEGSRRAFRSTQANWQLARAAVVFLAVAAFMASMRKPWVDEVSVSMEAEQYRNMTMQLHAMHPSFKPAARLLFVDDPIQDEYQLLMLVRLSYGREDLQVGRSRFLREPLTADLLASYDYVIYYRAGRFSESRNAPVDEPSIVIDWGKVAVFHDDWSPVDDRHPAKAGEHVISKMTNLGATDPAVAAGQAFPKEPFLPIVAPLAVRVGGIEAEVGLKIGWPEQVNQYRVDFVIPQGVAKGNVDVVVSSGGKSGTGVGIIVK